MPQDLAAMEAHLNRWVVLIIINLILLPLILSLGFDPIWFGVIMTINMEMGLITPPVGLNLYVLKGISPHIALKETLIGSMPFICVLGIAIALFSVFPQFILFLPQLLY